MNDIKRIVVDEEHDELQEQKHSFKENVETFFSPQRAPFWIANAMGLAALSAVVTVAIIRYRRRRKVTESTITLPDSIQGVEVGSNIHLKICFSHSSERKLLIRGEKRLLNQFVCDVRDTRLRLFCKPQSRKQSHTIEATLSIPQLNSLSVVGNARVDNEGVNSVTQFSLMQHGGEIRSLRIESKRFSYVVSGEYTSDISFVGEELNFSATGKGYSHFDLEAGSLVCRMAGRASATLVGSLRKLSLTLLGRGEFLAENLHLPTGKLSLQEQSKAILHSLDSGEVRLVDEAQLTLSEKPDKNVDIALEDTSTILFLMDTSPSKHPIK